MSIAANLRLVKDRIAEACRVAGRDPRAVRIVAVSKTQPAEAVLAAVAAGADAIGENRVQEAADKRPLVAGATPWHLIGPLQRNKAGRALELFDVIETVDRVELADRLDALLAREIRPATPGGSPGGRVLPVFLEVNIGGEPQKSGVAPEEAHRLAEHVLRHCPHLYLTGLMTVPPNCPDPEGARPHFASLRVLADRLSSSLGHPRLELSMGMSDDYRVAVEEGADWVRLGRTVFGERRVGV
ncbi:MAG: YggS family pyridoxal phosphate-dependent enzyme [Acidobacteriota bacterium]